MMKKLGRITLILVLGLSVIPSGLANADEGIPWFGLIPYLLTGGPPSGEPKAVFSADPTSGQVPLTVDFDAYSSTDPDGSIESYEWDFDDGDSDTGEQITHTYDSAGDYTPELTVTDDDGKTDSYSDLTISVSSSQSLTASFTASPNSGEAPLDVSFDASDSNDPDGNIDSYIWDFGDGSTGTGEIITHTYSSSGTYTVELTITDNDQSKDQKAKIITVNAPTSPSTSEIEEALETYIYSGAILNYSSEYSSGYGNALLLDSTTSDSGQVYHGWITVRHMYQGTDYTYEIKVPNGDTYDILSGGYSERFFLFLTKETTFTPFLEISSQQNVFPWSEVKKGVTLHNVAWEKGSEGYYQHFSHGDVIEVFSKADKNSLVYEVDNTNEHGHSGSGVFHYEDLDGDGHATSNEFQYVGLTNTGWRSEEVYLRETGVTYGIPDTEDIETISLGGQTEALANELSSTQSGLELIKKVIRKAEKQLQN